MKRTLTEAEKALAEVEELMWERLDAIREAKSQFKPVPEFPHLMVLIDEGMVLSTDDTIMKRLLHIASIGREPRIHLLYGTQRPSHEILPVTTRDQLEGRFVFHLNERTSSEVVLGHTEAYEMERKPGRMIHRSVNGDVKLQAAYIDEDILQKWLMSFAEPDSTATPYGTGAVSGHREVISEWD